MIAETVLTLVATILSIDQGLATVDRGRTAGLRPGDAGRIYYELTVGGETKRIDVGEGTVIEVEDSRSRLRIAGDAAVRPGYLVELEIPLQPTGSGARLGAGDPALDAWIERLVPGNREVQAEIARLILERRTRRGPSAASAPVRDAELQARVAKLEAALEAGSRADDLRGQLRREQAALRRAEEALAKLEERVRELSEEGVALRGRSEGSAESQKQLLGELAESQADVGRLTRQLRQAETEQRRLQTELSTARAATSLPPPAASPPPPAEPRPRTAAPPAEDAPSPDAEVLAAARDWAQAWSDQRVDDYLSFYASGFRPPDRLSRSQWEAQRRPRVLGPSFIEVELSNLEILSFAGERATVKFRQIYTSDRHRVSAIKVLELVKEGGRWKIQAETIR